MIRASHGGSQVEPGGFGGHLPTPYETQALGFQALPNKQPSGGGNGVARVLGRQFAETEGLEGLALLL